MATTATKTTAKEVSEMNVYQKLLKARAMFLSSDAKKTGKNMHLAFKYFELDDIVPIVTKIFEEIGLISLVSFEDSRATMCILNTADPEQTIYFNAPMEKLDENKGTNSVQAFGATITYYRRYLYMMAMDICEPDSLDPSSGTTAPTTSAPVAPPPAAPTTTAPKTAPVKLTPTASDKPLTGASGNASDIQIKQLKEVLTKYRDGSDEREEAIAKIAVETKGFTVISKADCEALVIKITELMGGN